MNVSSHPIWNTKCSYRSIFVAAQFAWLPIYWSEYSDRRESREYFPNCKFFQSLRIFPFRSSSSWKFREVESKFALASNAGRQIQIFPIFSQVWNWKKNKISPDTEGVKLTLEQLVPSEYLFFLSFHRHSLKFGKKMDSLWPTSSHFCSHSH